MQSELPISRNKTKYEVNKDLDRERQQCNFNIEEVTYIFDGGKENTLQRRDIEHAALDNWEEDEIPEECLSYKERYETAIRKSVKFAQLMKDEVLRVNDMEKLGSTALRRTADAFCKEISPFLLHMGMFVPTIFGQGTSEQLSTWLPRALNLQIVGTYAQTELGHGTFIRGLETTATYDPATEEFVLHSPTLTAYKWWGGGLGKTVNYCIVVAQLYTQGKCHGPHTFIVQIRDEETHMPLPRLKVGEIGPRFGYNTADNGFLGFDHYRIPRDHMLMKNSKVLKDGTYVKVARHEKLTYGTMVFVRVTLVKESAFNLAKAATIAVRYSAVRRQCKPKPDEPEVQILDYPTQQHKLFITVATAYALSLTAAWLWKNFTSLLADMRHGNTDNLPELHALSSCLKALSTSDSAQNVEICRQACGGHGYMASSNLPQIYTFVSATRTYEGDYTVLLLQTARFLVKAWEQAEKGNSMTPTVAYMIDATKDQKVSWDSTPEGIIRSFDRIAAGKTRACVRNIRQRVEAGCSNEDAWQLTTVQLVSAAEAHCRAVISKTYWNEIVRLTTECSPNTRVVMQQLSSLYLVYWALERSGDLLRYSSISEEDLIQLQHKYEELLNLIRPNAVGLVDAFDMRDEILQSTLGAYDGQVYERMMAEALKTPLNAEPVNISFHKYIQPFRKANL